MLGTQPYPGYILYRIRLFCIYNIYLTQITLINDESTSTIRVFWWKRTNPVKKHDALIWYPKRPTLC